MEQIYKIRIIATPFKGHKRDFHDFSKCVKKLECGDDDNKLFSKIAAHSVFSEGIEVSGGQWIVADEEYAEFCLSGPDPSMLVEMTGYIARVWKCTIHAAWAGKITELSYYVPWSFRSYYEDVGCPIYCASMGRAVFYGDDYGYYRAPLKSDKDRQKEYYSFVWGNGKKIETMNVFFADEPVLAEKEDFSARDEMTYPAGKIIDVYGNKVSLCVESRIEGHIAFGNEEVYALPVRKMLVEGKTSKDFMHGMIIKYDKLFEKFLRKSEVNCELEYLRSVFLATGDFKVDVGGFLLDKKGNKVKSLSDFDHAVGPDGEIFYRIFKSDFDGESLTSKAAERWRKKLGILNSVQKDENFCYNADRTEVIEFINKSARSVCVEEGIKKIRENAFKNCTFLEEISLPSTLVEIGYNAFENCSSLKSVSIPDGVKELTSSMGAGFSGTFSGCSELESITLGKSLEKIDIFTFNGCTSLKKIIIPRSVKEIVEGAFNGCPSLTEIIIEEGNENYRSEGGLIYSADGTVLCYCLESVGGTVRILDTVRKFENSPFSFNQKIKKIIIPPLITDLILDEAFGTFAGMSNDLEIDFSNPKGWYGTVDYDAFRNHKGGCPIPPEELQSALKKYQFLYNVGLFVVKN